MKRWTDEEIDILRVNYRVLPRAQIALMLGRTLESVRQQAGALGLTSPKDWTDDEEAILAWSWGMANVGTIASKLGRTPEAVRSHAYRVMHLRTKREGNMSVPQAAKKLGYGTKQILKLAGLEGITLPTKARVEPSSAKRCHRFVTPEAYDELVAALERRGFPKTIKTEA